MAKIALLARTKTENLEKHTGKDWDQWISILSKAGAQNLSHKEIVHLLKTKYKLKPWWQQIVTGGFEIHTGKRIEGQNEKGEYSVTVTKSLNVSQKKLWKFMNSEEGLGVWLKPMSEFHLEKGASFEVIGGIFGEVRTMQAPSKVRLRWEDSEWPKKSVLQLYIAAKPKDKCLLVFTHEQITSPRIKEKMRTYWKTVVDEIISALNI